MTDHANRDVLEFREIERKIIVRTLSNTSFFFHRFQNIANENMDFVYYTFKYLFFSKNFFQPNAGIPFFVEKRMNIIYSNHHEGQKKIIIQRVT